MKTIVSPVSLFAVATLTPAVLIGVAAIFGGVWIWAGLIYLALLSVVLDEAIQFVTPPAQDNEFPVATTLSAILGIAHFVVLALVMIRLVDPDTTGLAKAGLFLATGMFFGQISNSNAHELIHRGGRGLHRLGQWVYISLLFGHHTSAHVLVHHRHVATPLDPSSSRLGESYYRFARRAWVGSFKRGWAAETERQQRIAAPWYQHPYLTYILGALGFVVASWLIGGWAGVVIYVSLAGFSTSQLLLSDFIQHYGLRRAQIDGRFEPVGPQHSWNSPHWFSSAVMLNAPRHSDHHTHPTRNYSSLIIPGNSPMLPRSLPVMACIALSPRLWRKVMDPLVAQWSATSR